MIVDGIELDFIDPNEVPPTPSEEELAALEAEKLAEEKARQDALESLNNVDSLKVVKNLVGLTNVDTDTTQTSDTTVDTQDTLEEPLFKASILSILEAVDFDAEEEYLAELDLNDQSSVIKVIKDIADLSANTAFANDEIKAINDFVKNGGDIRTYFDAAKDTSINYTSLDYSQLDNKKLLANEYYKIQGLSVEEANANIKELIDSDELTANVNLMAKFVARYQETMAKEAQQEVLRQQALEKAARESEEQLFRTKIANAKSIAGIEFKNNTERENFIAFTKSKGANGKTAFETIVSDNDALLNLQMLAFKGYHKDKVVAISESIIAKRVQETLASIGKPNPANKGNKDTAKATANTLDLATTTISLKI